MFKRRHRAGSILVGGIVALGLLTAYFLPNAILTAKADTPRSAPEKAPAPKASSTATASSSMSASGSGNGVATDEVVVPEAHGLMMQPPDWSELHNYAIVVELPGENGGTPQRIAIEGEALYERVLKDCEAKTRNLANSELYLQTSALLALETFLRRYGDETVGMEFLRSRGALPEESDFAVSMAPSEDGFQKLVINYQGALAFDGSRQYRLLVPEGQTIPQEQREAFAQQCALDVALKHVAPQVQALGNEKTRERFQESATPRTLGAVLRQGAKVWIEVPNLEPDQMLEQVAEAAGQGIGLRRRDVASER